MAEFEIIGDEHTAGGEEEMDEATRQFLEEERRQLEAMGVNDDFGGNDEGHADEDFGGFEGEGHDAPANEGFADEAFGGSEQHEARGSANYDDQPQYDQEHVTNGVQYGDNPFNDDAGAQTGEAEDATDTYAAFSGIQQEIDEPESVRKWRTDFASRVAAIDARSAEKKEEMLSKAKEDLAAFYTNYEHQKETAAAGNREAEASAQASKEEPTGADWEQVASMCDFNPKSQVGSRDKSRMRGMLLQLKQTPLVR